MLIQKGLELNLFTDYDDPEQRLIGMRCSDGTKICDFSFDTNKVAIEKFGSTLASYTESYAEQLVLKASGKVKLGGQWFYRQVHYSVHVVTTKPFKKTRMKFNAKYRLFGISIDKVGCDFEVSSITLKDWGFQIKEWARSLPMPTLTLIEKPKL